MFDVHSHVIHACYKILIHILKSMQVTLLKSSCFVSEGIIMSLRQLMPSLGEELDNLWARINHLGARVNDLEALSGVGLPSCSLGSLSAGPTCADPRHQWIRTWERSKVQSLSWWWKSHLSSV